MLHLVPRAIGVGAAGGLDLAKKCHVRFGAGLQGDWAFRKEERPTGNLMEAGLDAAPTLAEQIHEPETVFNPNAVKVVSDNVVALFFLHGVATSPQSQRKFKDLIVRARAPNHRIL